MYWDHTTDATHVAEPPDFATVSISATSPAATRIPEDGLWILVASGPSRADCLDPVLTAPTIFVRRELTLLKHTETVSIVTLGQ